MNRKFTCLMEEGTGYLEGAVLELRNCETEARSLGEVMSRSPETIFLCRDVSREEFSRLLA